MILNGIREQSMILNGISISINAAISCGIDYYTIILEKMSICNKFVIDKRGLMIYNGFQQQIHIKSTMFYTVYFAINKQFW